MPPASLTSSWERLFKGRLDQKALDAICVRCRYSRARHRAVTDECPGSVWGSKAQVFVGETR